MTKKRKTEVDINPFNVLSNVLSRLINRLRKQIVWDYLITIVAIVIGACILAWTLSQGELAKLGSAGAAMIALSGLFFGTISLTTFLSGRNKSNISQHAKDLKLDIDEYAGTRKIEFPRDILEEITSVFTKITK